MALTGTTKDDLACSRAVAELLVLNVKWLTMATTQMH